MNQPATLPNGRILLRALGITPGMLRSLAKMPISGLALHALVKTLIATLPFDEEFYAAIYPDLAAARDCGSIADLRTHFFDHGYWEGRLGAPPQIDDDFYRDTYPDVAAAIARGEFTSPFDHFIKACAAEGGFATAGDMQGCRDWQTLLAQV